MIKGKVVIEVYYCCERMKSECEYGVLGFNYDICEKQFMLDDEKVLIECPFCKELL